MSDKKHLLLIPPGLLTTTFPSIFKTIPPHSHIHLYQPLHPPPIQTSNQPNNPPTPHPPLSNLNYTLQQPRPSIHIQKTKQ
ncbi:malate:quinone oxidoreductase, partial [Staphylococcus epidermidis]|uniref:malate:quinone oxidoreductase n=1 Tax=Staphylococcus epidermidis TaxID=1282 RepID=UPI0037D9DEFB